MHGNTDQYMWRFYIDKVIASVYCCIINLALSSSSLMAFAICWQCRSLTLQASCHCPYIGNVKGHFPWICQLHHLVYDNTRSSTVLSAQMFWPQSTEQSTKLWSQALYCLSSSNWDQSLAPLCCGKDQSFSLQGWLIAILYIWCCSLLLGLFFKTILSMKSLPYFFHVSSFTYT